MDSFQSVKPSEVRHLFRKLCVISSRYAQRQKAAIQLNEHIKRLKKHSSKKEYHQDLSVLQDKIKDYVQLQKKIRIHVNKQNTLEESLQQRVQSLEAELENERQEKQSAVNRNRDKIEVLMQSLSVLKRQIEILSRKEQEKEQKMQFLESRISSRIK